MLYADMIHIGIDKNLVGTNASKKDFVIGMTVFVKEFAQSEGVDYDITYYESVEELAEAFKAEKINFAVAESLSFVRYFDKKQLIPAVMAYKTNKEESSTLLLLKRTEDRRKIKEILQGKAIYNGDKSIKLYLQTVSLENSIKNSEVVVSKNAQQSILKLFFKKGDYALVDEASYKLAIELNPQLKESLEVLQSVPLRLDTLSFMNANMPKELHNQLIKSALTLNQTQRGKQLLQMFKTSIIDVTSASELDNLYALQAKHDDLLGKKQGNSR